VIGVHLLRVQRSGSTRYRPEHLQERRHFPSEPSVVVPGSAPARLVKAPPSDIESGGSAVLAAEGVLDDPGCRLSGI
jgi:hypothetical protein